MSTDLDDRPAASAPDPDGTAAPVEYRDRDATIAIDSDTTVSARETVPHETFAAHRRDVHGPLCPRVAGLGW